MHAYMYLAHTYTTGACLRQTFICFDLTPSIYLRLEIWHISYDGSLQISLIWIV